MEDTFKKRSVTKNSEEKETVSEPTKLKCLTYIPSTSCAKNSQKEELGEKRKI